MAGALTDLVGGHLPVAAMDTAKDSLGGGLAVAQQVAKRPQGGAQQAQALVDAVMLEAGEAVATMLTSCRRPEPRGAPPLTGCWGDRETSMPVATPRFSPGLIVDVSPDCTAWELTVGYKVIRL
ncbi:DhaL domain-containing protein OS=Streptomyces aurantiogriseus OX=66870 GN=GCM10010251_07070 PE=4 SV=1 [Streptomyces aurantiogriseus]|uniref:DhaL domain-containing protein n=1 Tax=Streptomyces aurantiogriseus TaxID=66870 RepID=A0A918F2D7_9ACTN|nr:hypothetical protein GCM10010251_07070 [Streptomyces aurantiogriseus]